MIFVVTILTILFSALTGEGGKALPPPTSCAMLQFVESCWRKGTNAERSLVPQTGVWQYSVQGVHMTYLEHQYRNERKRLRLSAIELADCFDIDVETIEKIDSGAKSPAASLVQAMRGLPVSFQSNLQRKEGKLDEKLNPKWPQAERNRQKQIGQFFTTSAIADFMTSLFDVADGSCHLLDAGAGKGALTSAFSKKWLSKDNGYPLTADLFETDIQVLEDLSLNLSQIPNLSFRVYHQDFLEAAARSIGLFSDTIYSHAILNPPYKKIDSLSAARNFARAIGFETVNLYTAFVGAALKLLKVGGQLVAIIPRSFCNGPYYAGFRKFMFENASLENIHIFESRRSAFAKDAVLQENVIIKLRRGVVQGNVMVSSSIDETMSGYQWNSLSFDEVVRDGDPDMFIHIKTGAQTSFSPQGFTKSLSDLAIECSTGPLVDFRCKDALRSDFTENCFPLIYPAHFSGVNLDWPKSGFKKSNAVLLNDETAKSAWPKGYYVGIRRFSSKEEKRRVFAAVIDPAGLPGSKIVFENHLNVLHVGKSPIRRNVAWGLCAYLNSGFVDEAIRAFSGHTQINATDIRKLNYPTLSQIVQLGDWFEENRGAGTHQIDNRLAEMLT